MVAKLVAFGHTTLSSLTGRNFRLYFIGQMFSQTGGWVQSVAQAWLVLRLTGSPAALGIVAALQFGPTLLLGPYAGVLADRMPKRKLLLVTQLVAAVLTLGLGLAVAFDLASVWLVYVTAGLMGVVNAIDYPTRQSFLYELTGPGQVLSAVGLTSTAANLARVAGPAIAGALIAGVGMAACFLLNAASFITVIACLLLMRTSELHPCESVSEKHGLRRGFEYAVRTPVVREVLLMMTVIGVLTYEFNTTLPAFVKISLGGSAAGLAVLMSAMGVGAAIGGLISAGRRNEGLGSLAVNGLLFGVSTAAVGLTQGITSAAAVMFFVGVFAARFTALSNGMLQLRSEPRMRNRVMALWSTAFLGSTFVGAPLMGWIAEAAGPRWSLGTALVGGLAAGVVGLLAARRAAGVSRVKLSRGVPVLERAAA